MELYLSGCLFAWIAVTLCIIKEIISDKRAGYTLQWGDILNDYLKTATVSILLSWISTFFLVLHLFNIIEIQRK